MNNNNPLSILVHRLGIDPNYLATEVMQQKKKAMPDLVNVLSPEPAGEYALSLDIFEMLGIRLRIEGGSAWRDTVPNQTIDALVFDAAFRSQAGFPAPAGTPRQVRDLCRAYFAEGFGLAAIVGLLEDGHIPTCTGLRRWRRSTVKQHLERDGINLDDPIVPDEEFFRRWRREVADRYLARTWAFAPRAVLEFKITTHFGPEQIVFESYEAMPACLSQWARRRQAEMNWFGAKE